VTVMKITYQRQFATFVLEWQKEGSSVTEPSHANCMTSRGPEIVNGTFRQNYIMQGTNAIFEGLAS